VNVFLVRAAMAMSEAEAPNVAGALRGLSAEGRQTIRAIGNKLRLTDEPIFDSFITSPDVASVQTAELFAERTDYVGTIVTQPLLSSASPGPAQVIAQELLKIGESKRRIDGAATNIVVVADEPLLAQLGAFLVGRPTFPPGLPAQISVIEDRKPAWCLRPGEMARSLLLVA
jgi:phosphohistidine phosphatase SixA